MTTTVFTTPSAARAQHKAYWLFPDVDRSLVGRLRMDDVALYSTTDQRSASQICDCLAELIPDPWTASVLDATACSGGSTYAFHKRFGKVEAAEVDPLRFRHLVHNLRTLGVLGLTRRETWGEYRSQGEDLTLRCCDAVDRLREAEAHSFDVVFVDPPWGGPHVYRKAPSLRLSLSGTPLSAIVRDVLVRDVATLVALKIPANFDVEEMESTSGGCVRLDRSIGGGKMRLLVLSRRPRRPPTDRFKHIM